MAATTRSTLRASLQRKSDNQLTVAADQDLYLDLADRQSQRDWAQFDPSILRYSRDSAATDADGILLMDANFFRLERLEKSDETKLPLIKIEDRYNSTGYYFAGWGNSNTQRQLQVMESGSALASTTLYFFAQKLSEMGSGTSAEPVIPEEYRDILAVKAAELYFQDQGPPFINVALHWEGVYNRKLEEAKRAYRTLDDEPVWSDSIDPDAGGGQGFVVHRT